MKKVLAKSIVQLCTSFPVFIRLRDYAGAPVYCQYRCSRYFFLMWIRRKINLNFSFIANCPITLTKVAAISRKVNNERFMVFYVNLIFHSSAFVVSFWLLFTLFGFIAMVGKIIKRTVNTDNQFVIAYAKAKEVNGNPG